MFKTREDWNKSPLSSMEDAQFVLSKKITPFKTTLDIGLIDKEEKIG